MGEPASILAVLGTRPEAIKLSPVLRALARAGRPAQVCAAARHRELLDGMLRTGDLRRPRIRLLPPLGYRDFVRLMAGARRS